MATIFVSKSGTDGAAGTKAAPHLTLEYAYSTAAVDGDSICLLDPYGEWFETWSALGYIQFNKASMTTGVHFYSYDPSRPARIGGDPTASGAYSVRIASSGHRFSNIDIYSSSASNTTIFGCNSSSVIDNVRLRNCRIVNYHDISSASSAYMLQLAGTGVHTNWELQDCILDPGPAHNLNGIYTGNSDGFKIIRTKVNLPRYGSGYALRVYLGSVETYILESELDGNYGILQDTAAQGQEIVIVDSKVRGRTYAASFGGTSSGTCRIFMRGTKVYGDSIGLAGQSNIIFDAEGVDAVSDNVAIGMPIDGAYSNTQCLMENCKSSAVGISGSGHALLFGVGSVNAVVNTHLATARRSTGWAGVFKGSGGLIEDSHFVGGGTSTLYFKGAADWTMIGCHAIQEVGGTCVEVKNGDPTPLSSGLKLVNNKFTVTNGSLYDWGSAAHEDETSTVDYNVYQVLASGTWGNIQGVSVTSLATLQAEWDAYPITTNDDNSVEDGRVFLINDYDPTAITASFEDAATIGSTEYSLPNDSTTLTARTEPGVWQIMLDLSAVSGDTYSLKVYEKIQSGGTQRVIYSASLDDTSGPNYVVPAVLALKHGWDVTLTKDSGTDRSIGWSIRRVG